MRKELFSIYYFYGVISFIYMTIPQLVYFTSVIKYGTISKAAKRLYVSQPAISLSIKELEEEFGVKLFQRNNNQLQLTEEGKYFNSLALDLLADYNQTIYKFKKYIRHSEILKLGIPPMIGTFLLPKLSSTFSDLYPNIQMQISSIGSIGNLQAIENKEVDLSIVVVRQNQTIHKNLEWIKIGETNLVFTVGNNHKLARNKTISIEEIKDTPLIMMNEDTLQSQIIDEAFKNHDMTPNVKIRTNQLITITELLNTDNYGAFLFNQLVKNNYHISLIPLTEPIVLDLILVWNKNTELSPATISLINFIKENNIWQ